MSKLTVTIPDDLHQQIRDELERQGITTSQLIEQAVTKVLAEGYRTGDIYQYNEKDTNQKLVGTRQMSELVIQVLET